MKNIVKILVLFSLVFFISCNNDGFVDKENIVSENKLKNLFKKEDFKKILPYKYQVDWNKKREFSKQLDTYFYEFDLIYENAYNPDNLQLQVKHPFYHKYKLIARQRKNGEYEFLIAKYFIDSSELPNIESKNLSINISKGYEGTLHLYDKNKELIFAKHISKNANTQDFYLKTENKKKNISYRWKRNCKTVTWYHYKKWYKIIYDYYGNPVSVTYIGTTYEGKSEEEECHDEWIPEPKKQKEKNDNCLYVDERGNCVSKYVDIKPILVCPEGYINDGNGDCISPKKPDFLGENPENIFSLSNNLDLTDEQTEWLNDYKNAEAKQRIDKFLSSYFGKTEFDEAEKFAVEVVNIWFKNSLDGTPLKEIDFNVFEVYYCPCKCSGSETEYITDLESNMEPKWGQLANKQEILKEINSISNLGSLSFDEQIEALISHFNKNLTYKRNDKGNLFISNPNADVNKYIYTELVGWIDFHHVFKLFKWAKEKGVYNALLTGEVGELVQKLKGNYSAYSYEDLPSNNVGVALFIRFGEQLKNKQITWSDAISIALDEMKSIQPENAPNFNYIPHIVNNLYPKNFTYRPFLGKFLKEYHKKMFCKRTKEEQKNIKEAHEKFRR